MKPLYDELQILNINGIYKLAIAKFKAKISSKTLSEDFSRNSTALTSVHKYSIRSALSSKYFMWKEPLLSKLTDSLKYLVSMFRTVYLIASEIKQLLPAAKLIQKYSKEHFSL